MTKYPEDLKLKVLEFRKTHTIAETQEEFKISKSRIEKWLYPSLDKPVSNIQKEKTRLKYKTNAEYRQRAVDNAKLNYQNNKQQHIDYRKERYNNDPSYKEMSCKSVKVCYERYKQDPEWRNNKSLQTQEWHRNNPDKSRAQAKKYCANRFKNDINYRILKNYRTRLRNAVMKDFKSKTTTELLGCDSKTLKLHLESLFTGDMGWDNYGEWHVDHIMPCASFDLTKEEEQKRCFNYKNLQPLWGIDNLTKGASIIDK